MTEQEFHPIFPSDRQHAFERNWADRHDLPVETLAQYRHAGKEGYRLPGLATNFRTFCAGAEWTDKIPIVVHLPKMNPMAGRLLTTLAKSIHAQYVTAIEAAGAKVAIGPPSNCRQRLMADGKAFPKSSCEVCGQFSPNWRECDSIIAKVAQ